MGVGDWYWSSSTPRSKSALSANSEKVEITSNLSGGATYRPLVRSRMGGGTPSHKEASLDRHNPIGLKKVAPRGVHVS